MHPFTLIPPKPSDKPIAELEVGDRVRVAGHEQMVGASRVNLRAFEGVTDGSLDLVPVPKPPRTAERGEVWRGTEHYGCLCVVAYHIGAGGGKSGMGGEQRMTALCANDGNPDVAGCWSADFDPTDPKNVERLHKHFEFYAANPREAFRRLERES